MSVFIYAGIKTNHVTIRYHDMVGHCFDMYVFPTSNCIPSSHPQCHPAPSRSITPPQYTMAYLRLQIVFQAPAQQRRLADDHTSRCFLTKVKGLPKPRQNVCHYLRAVHFSRRVREDGAPTRWKRRRGGGARMPSKVKQISLVD